MKILLCGATGFIGTEVLSQAIKHNYVSHVYVLTRKELDKKFATNKKVTQIIHEDFGQYPEYLLSKLANYGIEGCIWCIGRRTIEDFKDKAEAERVSIHYPLQAANAFAIALATQLDPNAPPMKQKFPFRFVFISGAGAEQDQFRSLWVWADSRKMKGAMEKGVFDVADNSELIEGKRCLEAIALRPGGVLLGGERTVTLLSESVAPYIAVDRLARCAIRTAMEGSEGKSILENKDCLGDDWGMINSLTI